MTLQKLSLEITKSCGSNGLGKLMANKNLKAVVLRHQENLIPYDGEILKSIIKLLQRG